MFSLCACSFAEKDRYFASFNGTNELDIKVRGEKRELKPAAQPTPVMSASQSFQNNSTGTMKLNKSALTANSTKVPDSIPLGRYVLAFVGMFFCHFKIYVCFFCNE